MKKFIITVETNYGTELVCQIAPKRDIATEEEVRGFLAEYKTIFPDSKYHVYVTKEVNLPYVQL